MSSVIKVDIPEKSYDITIAPGSLDQLGEQMASLKLGKKVLLVSNPMIFKHYGPKAIASLENAGFQVVSYNLPPENVTKPSTPFKNSTISPSKIA